MDCVHSVVWYVEEETYVTRQIYSFPQPVICYRQTYVESVHVILASLLEGGGVCVCSNMFMFFENLDVKTLSFCCKNMSTHSFVSFRNISVLSLICLPHPPVFPFLYSCVYIYLDFPKLSSLGLF